MSLEASDVNDGAILGSTQRESNDKGMARLKIMLPSGRDLTSEYLNPEMLSTAVMLSWCESVREQVAFDANEKELAAKRKAQMAARDLEMPPIDPSPDAIGSPVGGLPLPPMGSGGVSKIAGAAAPAEVCPLAYAQAMLAAECSARDAMDAQQAAIMVRLRQHHTNAARWQRIVAQLEKMDDEV